MTAPGGWCVEVILLDLLDGRRPVVRYRVVRHGTHVATVVSPQQLEQLGVPVADLAEED
jgi:hypothetical protein